MGRAPVTARRQAACLLALVTIAAAALGVQATRCGVNANGKRCPSAKDCCSIYGYCGRGRRFCSARRCASGACYGKTPSTPAPRGCAGVCGVTVREGTVARATCRRGLVITRVPVAVYGAPSRRCNAQQTWRIVRRRCLGRNFCTVSATNGQFGGDPCRGVLKKLWFRYRCEKPKPQPDPTPTPEPAHAYYSTLWGRNGEFWRPTSRLADFSYAGYMGNQRRVPYYPAKFNVKRYGARGDGRTDDTVAVQRALQAASAAAERLTTYDCSTTHKKRRCPYPDKGFGNEGRAGVAVYLPPGTYIITRSLELTTSNVVLRGAGQGKTRLWFPKGLAAVYGKIAVWGTGGGFVIIDGSNAGSNQERNQLTPVTATARKGDRRLRVSSTSNINVGQWVRIYMLEHSPARRRLQSAATNAAAGKGLVSIAIVPPPPPTKTTAAGAGRGIASHNTTITTSGAGTGPNNSTGAAGGGTTPTANTRGAAANTTGSGNRPTNTTGEGYAPLSPTLQKLVQEAEQYAASEQPGVSAAARDGTVDAYLYGENLVDSGRNAFYDSDHMRFPSRVVAKGCDWIELERPLPYDIREEWEPYVYDFKATTQHSGVEFLTIQFRHDVYTSHLNTLGYNAIVMNGAANCWVRGVDIVDADNGVQVTQTDFASIADVRVRVTSSRASRSTAPDNGHHALWVGKSGDVAFTNFDIQNIYMHDLSVDGFSERCVFARGRGADINIDCHRAGPHNHLFSSIDMGRGSRPFLSGGFSSRGAHSGANNTFWNLYASQPERHPVRLPSCEFGPLLNFLGRYKRPDTGGRRRQLLGAPGETGGHPANGTPSEQTSSGADVARLVTLEAAGRASATAPGDAPVHAATAAEEAVQAAGAAYIPFPNWCPDTRWRTELAPPGRKLLPDDLYYPMIRTRRNRLRL